MKDGELNDDLLLQDHIEASETETPFVVFACIVMAISWYGIRLINYHSGHRMRVALFPLSIALPQLYIDLSSLKRSLEQIRIFRSRSIHAEILLLLSPVLVMFLLLEIWFEYHSCRWSKQSEFCSLLCIIRIWSNCNISIIGKWTLFRWFCLIFLFFSAKLTIIIIIITKNLLFYLEYELYI